MKIRRYEIDYVFDVLNRSQIHPGVDASFAKFICIPRYNACINLKESSIGFFFRYVYKVRSTKTYLIWFLLRLVALFPRLHGILNKVGLMHEIKMIKSLGHMDWGHIDLLYIEWHFFGVFSQSKESVAHVLAKPAYEQRFENEIKVRQYGTKCKELSQVLPKLLKVSENPKYYIEELAVDSGKQLITKDQLNTAQIVLKQLNSHTQKNVSLDLYYRELIDKLGDVKNAKLLKAKNLLQNTLEKKYLNRNLKVGLALVHGDFNAGQVLSKNEQIKIIDWGDGGLLNRYFDYITIAIYRSPLHDFKPEFFPEELSILNLYFSAKMENQKHFELYVLLSLLEILVISKGEFEAQEGAYLRWITAVKINLI